MSLLGLDIGTTGCKAVIFSEEGKIISKAYQEYALYIPAEGQCELDPEEVWNAVRSVVRAAVADAGRKDPVRAIGISTIGDSVTPVDKKGRPLYRTVIGAADRRAADEAAWIAAHYGRVNAYEKTGAPLHAFCTLPKVMWFRNNKPEIFDRAWKFSGVQELFQLNCGLEPVVDFSLASHTMLMDAKKKVLARDLCAVCNIDPDFFSPLGSSNALVGTLSRRWAEKLGFSNCPAVVAGGFDQCCCAFGAGVFDPGTVALSVGTLEAIVGISPVFRPSPTLLEGNFGLSSHVVDGSYIALGYVTTSGAILRWYRDTFYGGVKNDTTPTETDESTPDPYDAMIESTPDAPSSVFVMPYFAGSGTPWLDTRQKGTVFGLSLTTSRDDIVKGILDGICCEVRLNIELLKGAGIEVKKLRAMGGGSKSKKWMQIKADITGTPVEVTAVKEAGCLGAAFLAGQGVGAFTSTEEMREITASERVFEPRPHITRQYEEYFQKYCELRARVEGLDV
jgi:xylulokinase